MQTEIAQLCEDLAELFAAEGRPGGVEVADALRDRRLKAHQKPGTSTSLDAEIVDLLSTTEALPAAGSALAVMTALPWHYSGYHDGRIRAEVALSMATCEILGPTGLIHCDSCKVGLFAQAARHDYPARNHAAEETFIMIAGRAEWQCDPGNWMEQGPGAILHHPSMAPHRSRTAESGLVAAWRWTGDIGTGSYALLE
ncbi:MAG: dimethylsulfonioproprionate lyase family protein [Pseudomonadota bacterium]